MDLHVDLGVNNGYCSIWRPFQMALHPPANALVGPPFITSYNIVTGRIRGGVLSDAQG